MDKLMRNVHFLGFVHVEIYNVAISLSVIASNVLTLTSISVL